MGSATSRWRRLDLPSDVLCRDCRKTGSPTPIHTLRRVLEVLTEDALYGDVLFISEIRYCPTCDSDLIRFTPEAHR